MMEPQEVFYPVTPAWSGTPAWLVYFGFKHMILALSSWPSVGLTFMAPLLPRRGLAQDRGQQGAVPSGWRLQAARGNMECKLINGLLLGRSIEVTVETLLKVICSQKICNSGQATLSDDLCHGYLGRFSLRGSLAVGGHAPPPSGLQPLEQPFVSEAQRLP